MRHLQALRQAGEAVACFDVNGARVASANKSPPVPALTTRQTMRCSSYDTNAEHTELRCAERVTSGLNKTAPDEAMRHGDASPARHRRIPLWPVDPRTTEYLVLDSSIIGLGPTPSSQLLPDRALLSPSSSPRAPTAGRQQYACAVDRS
ncbi:hypothetical protein GQ602_004850 [Ophiocordyceps camponoti-floridani]|uniref:Uncharacterized protein n=1 Tax=Ophiocordyceps camponoti-floridani TaxID=2030778 RepID=A0A8H4Q4K1_9HYPO|nr:hypothetical protein GQ602_004850 [Ophiocordyceps camponoti-floridani]